jgi:outer membrane protein insertion porin family
MGRLRRVLLVLALASAAGRAAASEIPTDLFGRTIESVAYTVDGPVDNRQVASLIVFAVGEPLTEDAAGATIRNLFATLGFSNIQIEAEPAAGGGVAVTVHLWRAFRVSHISFDGRSALSREDMRRAVPLSEGDPFNAAALAAGASALERRLSTEGYLHPTVEPEATFDATTFGVTIVFGIQAGDRGTVAAPFFDGETSPFAPELLEREGKIRVGKPYSEAQARAAAERIGKFLLRQGRLKESVELIAAEPTDAGQIRPVYRIAVGPEFRFETVGIKEKQFRKEIVALVETQGFNSDLLQQWIEDTRARLQREGRYRAQVAATATEGTDPVVLKATVEMGEKYAVEKIGFSGNTSVSDETLRGLMVTREKGLPLIHKGRLIDSDLDGDVSAILGYYQTRGWIDAKVEKPAVTEGARPDRLDIAIAIVEGPRTFVAQRRVEGAEHLGPPEIDRIVSVVVGQPFNPRAVRQDASALTAYYWNNGWREAAVQDHWTLSADRTKADVVYRIEEGMRSFFGKTILRGNVLTKPDRILRQVAWKEGEPFSEAKIADTQQNLARAGVFRSIEVKPQPADPDDRERNIDIQLSEAQRFSLFYGFGYQNAPGATENRNDVFAVVGGTFRNLFGSLRTASLEVQYAPISQRGHIFANFVEPYLFNTDIPLTVVAFASREPIQDIDIDRVGAFVESVRLYGQHLRLGVRYGYQQIAPRNPQDLSTIYLEQFPKGDLPIKQSAIGPSLLYDRRDNILDPHAGYYWTFAGNYAFKFLSANATYGKVSAQGAWFTQVLGGVLGVSARAGAIFPYDVQPEIPPVPLAEEFFAGGSATGRGFDTDLLGIPTVTVDYNTQATSPPANGPGRGTCAQTYTFEHAAQYDCNVGPRIVGGNGFMAWSFEYRHPILGNLGFSVFYDLAQVWANPGDINFHIEGGAGMRQSIGAGLHYMTPIGPLRLEVARPVELRTIPFQVTTTDEDNNVIVLKSGLSVKETGRIFLSIGYPF